MPRTAPLLAALALSCCALTACSSPDDDSAAQASPEVAEPQTSSESAADEAAATSDAQQLAIALETYYVEASTYPSAEKMSSAKFVQSLGVRLVKGNEIADYSGDASSYSFCIAATTSGAWAHTDSAEGLVGSGTEGATCERTG